MNTDLIRYAGFGPRLGSLLLDVIIMLPLSTLVFWADGHYRLFMVYYLIPGTLFGLFYGVYLVRRFGGTPGKLIVGIRIRKLDGEPVGYREAFLRYFPDAILGLLMSIALLFPLFRMSDSEYQSLASMDRAKRMVELAPSWYKPLQWIGTAWVWVSLSSCLRIGRGEHCMILLRALWLFMRQPTSRHHQLLSLHAPPFLSAAVAQLCRSARANYEPT